MNAKMTRRILAVVLTLAMVLTMIPAAFAFPDVPSGAWFEEAVNYCSENGLMGDVGDGTFNPNGKVTREQAVQTLYAMAGKPAVSYSPKFADVKEGQWYADAILWAVENNITSGMGDGSKFGVGVNVTREQIALFFYKYSIYAGMEEDFASLKSFPDADKVSSWAQTAVQWAVKFGIISGKGVNGVAYLKPQDTLTRAELAAMLSSFHKIVPPPCDHKFETVGAAAATCTADGYTGDVKCSECGFVQSKGEVIPAPGHDFVEGQCTRCGEIDPEYAREFVLTDEIAGGKQYIIYSPGHQMVIKNENNRDWNLIPESLTPEDDKFVETEPGALNDYVWTLVDNGDGTYSFVNGENKIVMWISVNDNGTFFELTNTADYPESDGNWKIVPADGVDNLFFIQHATFSNSYGPAYIECYYNVNKDITNISGYTCGNPAGDKYINDFGFQFYGFGKPCQHASTEDVAAVAPSCTEPGYTAGVRCTSCGKWISGHEVVPATGHSYVEGFCEYCGKAEPQGEEVVIYYPTEGKVMTTASKEYNGKLELVAANASLVDDKVVTSATDVAKFIMTEEDGVVTFATADGKYLYADGTHVKLADSEDENTKFVVEEAEGGVYLRCATAQFSGKPQYIEFFSGVFTVFSFQEAKANIYTFGLYPLGEGGGDDGEEADFVRVTADPVDWEGTYVIAYDLSATEALVFNGIADSDKNNVKATVSGDVLTTSVNYEVVVEKSGDGYTFKTKAGYLDGKTASGAASNGTTFNADARVGSLSWDSTKNIAVMTSAVGTVMRFNNGAVYEGEGNYEWFRFYKPASSVQTPVVLYKLNDGPACEHANTTTYDGTAASCTEPGYTAGVKCDDCGKWISGHEVVPATGHNFGGDNICDTCGYVKGEGFALTDALSDGMDVILVNPGSKNAVKAAVKASYYVDLQKVEIVDDQIETEDASIIWSVSENGDGTYTFTSGNNILCVGVNGTHTNLLVNAADGTYNAWTLVPATSAKTFFVKSSIPANEKGDFYLEYNGSYSEFTIYGSTAPDEAAFGIQFYAKGGCEHDWVAGTPVSATCTEGAYTPYTCSKCPATKKEMTSAPLGHNWVADPENSVAPGCVTAGINAFKCSRCPATTTEAGDPATGHIDVAPADGICDVCTKDLTAAGYTAATSIAVGDKIIIVAEHESKYYATVGVLGATDTKVNNALNAREVKLDGNAIADASVDEAAIVWEVVAGSADGTYMLKASDGKYMAYTASGTTLKTAAAGTDFAITCGAGTATVMATAADMTDRGVSFRNNAGTPQFRMYKTSNKTGEYSWAITIYKLG